MAYPFLAAKWISVGLSPCKPESVSIATEILKDAEARGKKILLPIDHIAIRMDDRKKKPFVTDILDKNMVACDIGPKTISLFESEIQKAGQVIWNGPLGKYEDPKFKNGTMAIAQIVAESKCYSIVGGGDSVSAVNKSGKANMISHLSTGGGATMKLLEGNSLPCLDVIQERIV